jgi:hypothetical protein
MLIESRLFRGRGLGLSSVAAFGSGLKAVEGVQFNILDHIHLSFRGLTGNFLPVLWRHPLKIINAPRLVWT